MLDWVLNQTLLAALAAVLCFYGRFDSVHTHTAWYGFVVMIALLLPIRRNIKKYVG